MNNNEFDKFDKQFDKDFEKAGKIIGTGFKFAIFWWCMSVLVSLTVGCGIIYVISISLRSCGKS
jgi:hypothetical protein